MPSRLGQLFPPVLLFGLLVSFLVFLCVCMCVFCFGLFGGGVLVFFSFFCLHLKSQPDIYFKINILHKKHLGNSIGTYHFHLATTLRS